MDSGSYPFAWDRAGETFWERLSKIVYKFKKKSFESPWEFEEQTNVLESSIIIINYCVIINAYYNYNYIINS